MYSFELLSGLSINFNVLCLSSGPNSNFIHTAVTFHCRIGGFPFSYLDLPTKPLLDHFNQKLASWKGHCLSRGRLILVNLVLTSLPHYYMSFFFLPQWVINRIDQLRLAFWKGDSFVSGGQCLIDWKTVCWPNDFNTTWLAKWWWKLLSSWLPWVR